MLNKTQQPREERVRRLERQGRHHRQAQERGPCRCSQLEGQTIRPQEAGVIPKTHVHPGSQGESTKDGGKAVKTAPQNGSDSFSPTAAPSLTTIQRWATPEPFLLQVRQRIPPTLVVLGELRVGGAPQGTNTPCSPGVSVPGSTHQVSSQYTESTSVSLASISYFSAFILNTGKHTK